MSIPKSNVFRIRTHRERVAAAKLIKQANYPNISRIDMEAIVEFLLLEDLCLYYQSKLQVAWADTNIKTKMGQSARVAFIKQATQVIYLLRSCTEVAKYSMQNDNFTSVWMAINESALTRASKTMKHIKSVIEMAEKIDETLHKEMLDAEQFAQWMDERSKEIDSHWKNVETYRGVKGADVSALVGELKSEIGEQTVVAVNENELKQAIKDSQELVAKLFNNNN